MIKRVLVGVDINISESMPMDYAASLCKVLGAELVALHVIEELQVYNLFGSVPALKRDEILKEREAIVIEAMRLGEKYGIKATGKIVEGMSPAEEMLREANEGGFDLIVTGCHAKSALMECLLGGVSSQIVHHSMIPVLIVKSKRSFSRILMCTGGSKYAEDAIAWASEIAEKAGSRVTVLSVAPSKDKEAVATAQNYANRGANILKGKGVEATAKVRTGHAAEEILIEAREEDYRLIVMGYKGTSAVVDLLLGDVVSKVTHHSRRPTLVFRERKLKKNRKAQAK
jgi:nucleotide-binding universal stress UspA family protein